MSQNFGAAQQQQDQGTPQTLPVLPIKESHQLLKDNGEFNYFYNYLINRLFFRFHPTALPQIPEQVPKRSYASRRG